MSQTQDTRPRECIIVLTHFCNRAIADLIDRLDREAPAHFDIHLLINAGKKTFEMPAEFANLSERVFLCNNDSLMQLGYPAKCSPVPGDGKPWSLNPGNTDLLMMAFYRAHPDYEYYWGLEYDVHYQGNWSVFFRYFSASRSDMIATMVCPAKYRAKYLDFYPVVDAAGSKISIADTVSAFFPIHRLSQAAISTIDRCYSQGWGGHYELAWPTILQRHNLTLEDIGGDGPYVKPENRNTFYFCTLSTWSLSPGNFVFRPVFQSVPDKPNTLWHPVKPDGDYSKWRANIPPTGLRAVYERVKPMICKVSLALWFTFVWRKLPDPTADNAK